jgi:hypothetical protein
MGVCKLMITQQEKIIKAIQKINPSAEVKLISDNLDEIVWLGETTSIPVADIQAQIPIVEQEIANEEQAKIDAKASGNQKLLDLGLTQAEATALTGYTPPVAE